MLTLLIYSTLETTFCIHQMQPRQEKQIGLHCDTEFQSNKVHSLQTLPAWQEEAWLDLLADPAAPV